MFHQFARLETSSWMNGKFDNMLAAFPMLKEFPHISDGNEYNRKYWSPPATEPHWRIAHEFGHLMQFFINGEERRILLNNFGWPPATAFDVKGIAVATREAEVFALQMLFIKHFPEFEGDDKLSSLKNLSGVCTRHFEGSKEPGRDAYWKERIESNMALFDNIFLELASKTFEFIIKNKSLFCID